MAIGKTTKIWHQELSNIHENVEIGEHCTIHSHVWIGEGVKIGNNVKIQAFSFIPSGVTIEDDAFIGPRVTFTNDKNPPSDKENWLPTHVKKGAVLGASVTVVCGNTIGENSTIGAGALVTKDIPDNVVACGVPATVRAGKKPKIIHKKNPRVAIIYPPNQLMPIETPRPDGSLGPLYLAGALRELGIEADVLDATIGRREDDLKDTFYNNRPQENGLVRIGMDEEKLKDFFGKGYDIVCISSNFTPQTNMAFEVARIAREVNPKSVIVAGGTNAKNLVNRFMATQLFDLIALSEGEETIKEIATRVREGHDLLSVVGTIDRNNVRTPAKLTTDLDKLPMPAWDKLLFEKYDQIASPHGIDLTAEGRYAPIMTSRGCPFRCEYCHISTEKGDIGDLRLKSIPRVLEEIQILKSLGVKKLFIEDDSLLAKKGRIKELFNAIKDEGLSIADVNGVNLVHLFHKSEGELKPDKDYIKLLYDSGFKQIVFPVESGSQRVLDKYASAKLKLDKMNVVELTKQAVEVGIQCPVNMMIGFPDETEEEMMKSVDLAKQLIEVGAPYVTFFIPIPFPGSQLYNYALRNKHLKPDFDPDTMNWKNGVMENTTVPKERIVEIRDRAWEEVNKKEHVIKRINDSMKTRILSLNN